MDQICVHVVVSGVVQGVCYRAFVWENARLIGVNGWVKNLPDGRVEAELEGESAKVTQVIDAMKIGPRMAHVASVNVTDLPYQNRHSDFRVR